MDIFLLAVIKVGAVGGICQIAGAVFRYVPMVGT